MTDSALAKSLLPPKCSSFYRHCCICLCNEQQAASNRKQARNSAERCSTAPQQQLQVHQVDGIFQIRPSAFPTPTDMDRDPKRAMPAVYTTKIPALGSADNALGFLLGSSGSCASCNSSDGLVKAILR